MRSSKWLAPPPSRSTLLTFHLVLFSDKQDQFFMLTRFIFQLAVIQHFPRTGQLDKNPAAVIKTCCFERLGYKRHYPAAKRHPKPRRLQRLCGLLSAAQAERRGRSLAFNPSWNQHFIWFFACFFKYFHLNLSSRILVLVTVCTMRRTYYFRWPTFLELEQTPLQPRSNGLCCWWPNIHKYKVEENYAFMLTCKKENG